jgi:hypothetical protein
MPTKREREYYRMGFSDGYKSADIYKEVYDIEAGLERRGIGFPSTLLKPVKTKPKRKLSAWQKFVKANSKKPRFRYKSGAKKGRVNLKALGVAYRKKRR